MRIVGRVLLIVFASLAGVAIIAAIIVLALPDTARSRVGTVLGGQASTATFATAAPVTAAAQPRSNGVAGLADQAWLAATAKKTGIPVLALTAYAGVAVEEQIESPDCGIGWNTLAAIGEVESRHGTIFGGRITANGDAVPAIYGVSLDGSSTAHIPDSDGGAIDGDPNGDRAVGPMQLIPQAWRNWHADGNGDGVQNPQNIDDETLSAAHYLCRAGGDMRTEQGWRTAVLAYNSSSSYVAEVIRYATAYGSRAK
jgi:membrane-bound lytic murein transglycosylase B